MIILFCLQSTNGTYVNGVKVVYHRPLMDGSIVSFGPLSQSTFKYLFAEKYHEYEEVMERQHYHFMKTSNRVNLNLWNLCTQKADTNLDEIDESELLSISNLKQELLLLRTEKQNYLNDIQLERQRKQKIWTEIDMSKQTLIYLQNEVSCAEKQLQMMKNHLKESLCNQSSDSVRSTIDSCRTFSDPKLLRTTMSSILKEINCTICTEIMMQPTVLNCAHTFCRTCIEEWKLNTERGNFSCPICRVPINSMADDRIFNSVISIILKSYLTEQEQSDRLELARKREVDLQNHHREQEEVASDSSSEFSDDEEFDFALGSPPESFIREYLDGDNEDDEDDDDDDAEVVLSIPENNDDDQGVVISLRFFDSPNQQRLVETEEVMDSGSNLVHVDDNILIEVNGQNQEGDRETESGSLTIYQRIPSPAPGRTRNRNFTRTHPYPLRSRTTSRHNSSTFDDEVVAH